MQCLGSVKQARCEHLSQANIKPVYYYGIDVAHILSLHDDTRHHRGPQLTDDRWDQQAEEHWLSSEYHTTKCVMFGKMVGDAGCVGSQEKS